MPTWPIEIVEKNGVTLFDPPNQNALLADLVFWSNTTNHSHQPWMLDANGKPVPDPRKKIDPNKPYDECDTPPGPPNFDPASRLVPSYLSDCIAPGTSSRPAFNVVLPTGITSPISYYCKVHPTSASERGTITIVTQPPPTT
jgi:hypothetical protein